MCTFFQYCIDVLSHEVNWLLPNTQLNKKSRGLDYIESCQYAVALSKRHSERAEVTSFGHNNYTCRPHLHIHVGGNGERNKWRIS